MRIFPSEPDRNAHQRCTFDCLLWVGRESPSSGFLHSRSAPGVGKRRADQGSVIRPLVGRLRGGLRCAADFALRSRPAIAAAPSGLARSIRARPRELFIASRKSLHRCTLSRRGVLRRSCSARRHGSCSTLRFSSSTSSVRRGNRPLDAAQPLGDGRRRVTCRSSLLRCQPSLSTRGRTVGSPAPRHGRRVSASAPPRGTLLAPKAA